MLVVFFLFISSFDPFFLLLSFFYDLESLKRVFSCWWEFNDAATWSDDSIIYKSSLSCEHMRMFVDRHRDCIIQYELRIIKKTQKRPFEVSKVTGNERRTSWENISHFQLSSFVIIIVNVAELSALVDSRVKWKTFWQIIYCSSRLFHLIFLWTFFILPSSDNRRLLLGKKVNESVSSLLDSSWKLLDDDGEFSPFSLYDFFFGSFILHSRSADLAAIQKVYDGKIVCIKNVSVSYAFPFCVFNFFLSIYTPHLMSRRHTVEIFRESHRFLLHPEKPSRPCGFAYF